MLSQGFESVFHLEGGILQYLEDVDPSQNKWEGECFVFDDRVSVTDTLDEGRYAICRQCFEVKACDKPTDINSFVCVQCLDEMI